MRDVILALLVGAVGFGLCLSILCGLVRLYLFIMNRRVNNARLLIADYEQRTGHHVNPHLLKTLGLFHCDRCGLEEHDLGDVCELRRRR